jgi:hypothetical protein
VKPLSQIDLEGAREEAKRARDDLRVAISSANDALAAYNDANTKKATYMACPTCMAFKHVRAYHNDIGWLGRIPIVRSIVRFVRWFKYVRKFPNILTIMDAEVRASWRLYEKRFEAIRQQSEAYLRAKKRAALYDEEQKAIQALNAVARKINGTKADVEKVARDARAAIETLQGIQNGFKFRVPEGDAEDPEVQLALIGQSRAMVSHYDTALRRIIREMEAIREALGPVLEQASHVVRLCGEAEAMTGESETAEIKRRTADADVQLRGQVSKITRMLDGLDGGLPSVASRQWDVRTRLGDLSLVVGAFGNEASRRLLATAMDVRDMRARLAAVASGSMSVADVERLLRQLSESSETSGFGRHGEGLVGKMIASMNGNGHAFRSAVLAYQAGDDFLSEAERMIYLQYLRALVDGGSGTAQIEGRALSRLQFLERSAAALGGSLQALQHLATRGQFRMDLHAYRHAGASIGGTLFDTDTHPVMGREIMMWDALRNGDSPYSAAALGVSEDDDPALAHYVAVAAQLVGSAPALIAIYDEKPGVLTPLLNLCFVRDMGDLGFPGQMLYTAFDYSLSSGVTKWKTLYITTPEVLLRKSSLSFLVPIPRSVLTI